MDTTDEIELSDSPSMQDGYHGARDARLLEQYGRIRETRNGVITMDVQALPATRELLQRAGVKRIRMGDRHTIHAMRDAKYTRFLLAPVAPVETANAEVCPPA